MGTGHEAGDDRRGRHVALKLLHASAADPDALLRFEREARAAAGVRHVNLVRVPAADVERGRPWIAYELLEGGSLAERLRVRGRLPAREAAAIGAQVARAL